MHNSDDGRRRFPRAVAALLAALLAVFFCGVTLEPIHTALASGISFPAYSFVQNGGSALTQRNTLNFIFSTGAGSCVDNAGKTECSITGTTSGSVSTGVTLTSGEPVIGAGASAIAVGTKTGNTTLFASASGATTSGHLATWDASGNIIDGGALGSILHTSSINVGDGTNAITTGVLGRYISTGPETGNIVRVDAVGYGGTAASPTTCSITFDVWVEDDGTLPTSADKISGTDPASLTAATVHQSGSTASWTLPIAANSIWSGEIITVSGCVSVTFTIFFQQYP